ncbi:MAG: DUF1318 domain-containing protein [Rhodocyclales bacterium]|nr:DUF1318 domain-containing protein [Rhodocyclales bacterium]
MPNSFATALGKALRCLVGASAAALLLSACGNIAVYSGAGGTTVEAKKVAALVYAQAPDAEIDTLPYSGGDLTNAIKRLRDRYPQLKPWLDQGVIGNTASGFVALRDTARREQVRELLRAENRDRALLHNQASKAVGHGGEDLDIWLPYASYSFGKEWIEQGQPGWWWLNESRQWVRK